MSGAGRDAATLWPRLVTTEKPVLTGPIFTRSRGLGRRKWQPTPVFGGAWWAAVHGVAQSRTRMKQLSMHAWGLEFCSSDGKASAYNAGDPGLNPGSGRSPGEGNGKPVQYSCLESPMDGGAW